MEGFTVSSHAGKRWGERCKGGALYETLRRAKPASKSQRRRISHDSRAARRFNTVNQKMRYLIAEKNIVFVVNPDNLIVTVFVMSDDHKYRANAP